MIQARARVWAPGPGWLQQTLSGLLRPRPGASGPTSPGRPGAGRAALSTPPCPCSVEQGASCPRKRPGTGSWHRHAGRRTRPCRVQAQSKARSCPDGSRWRKAGSRRNAPRQVFPRGKNRREAETSRRSRRSRLPDTPRGLHGRRLAHAGFPPGWSNSGPRSPELISSRSWPRRSRTGPQTSLPATSVRVLGPLLFASGVGAVFPASPHPGSRGTHGQGGRVHGRPPDGVSQRQPGSQPHARAEFHLNKMPGGSQRK